jgi:cysteine desulfuration protein SufE
MNTDAALSTIVENFALLDDWEDRYRYVIELGREMPPFPDAERTDANKVRGCASQVWLVSASALGTEGGPQLTFTGDSDAHIVRGLVALLIALYSGRTPAEVLAADPHGLFATLGLHEHLTPQRSNGVVAMVARIRADAEAALGHAGVTP